MRRVVGADDRDSPETDDVVTRYTYTDEGLIETTTDALGRVTRYDYDEFGRMVTITFPVVGTENANAASQRFEYDAAGNQPEPAPQPIPWSVIIL